MAKIMLVEDDNNLREIYEARLLAEGYEIVSAKDGEEALAFAVKERPDLIISDVMMPKISGFDMLDILRSTPETKNTKVIMMTALSQAEDKARADKLGADRYLVKSQVTLEDVAKVAREVLNDEQPGGASPQAATSAPEQPTPPVDAQSTAAAVVAEPVVATPEPVIAPAVEPVAPVAAVASVPEPVAPAVPEPVVATPVASVPQPEPVTPVAAMPEPVIAPAVEPITPAAAMPTAEPVTPAGASTTVQSDAVSLADEEAAMNAQIDAFVAQATQNTAAPAAPAPLEVAADPASVMPVVASAPEEPAPTPEPVAAAPTDQPADPTVVAPTGAPEPAGPTVQDGTSPLSLSQPNNRRVISPLTDPTKKPDLNALLAQEEAKEMAQQAGQSVIDANNHPDPNSVAL